MGIAVGTSSKASSLLGNGLNTTADPHRKRNDLLQEFRGIAAVLVLMNHSWGTFASARNLGASYNYMGGFFQPGYSAVDFFFVLSGFLMVTVHRREEGESSARLLFFGKRICRVYFPYWVLLGSIFPLFFLLPRIDGGARNLSLRTFLENLFLLPQDGLYMVPPAWSLTYELFFYLIFGIFFFMRRGVFIGVGLVWFGLIMTVVWTDSLWNLMHTNKWAILVFNPRNIAFLEGVLVGYLADRISPRIKKTAFFVGMALFAAVWLENLLHEKFLNVVDFITMYGFASALIVLGTTAVDLGKRRLLIILGDASYSIYITHMSAMALVIRLGSQCNVVGYLGYFGTATAYVFGTLMIGVLFHYLFERPLMRASRVILARRPSVA